MLNPSRFSQVMQNANMATGLTFDALPTPYNPLQLFCCAFLLKISLIAPPESHSMLAPEIKFIKNLRRRVRGNLNQHDWTPPIAEAEEGSCPAGMDLPPIRIGTRDLLLRPPEHEWSVAGLALAVFNVVCVPEPAPPL